MRDTSPNPEIELRNRMTFGRLTHLQQTLVEMKAAGYTWADIGEELKKTKQQARTEYMRLQKYLPQVAVAVNTLRNKQLSAEARRRAAV